MAGAGEGDLTTRIHHGLASGLSRDAIVADLVKGGLSAPSAERLVDRALAQRDASASPRERSADAAKEYPGGRRAMVWGAFWLSLGSCVTGATYVFAKAGDPYVQFVLVYGPVIAGALAFARGLSRWSEATAAGPFPWRPVLVATALPVLGTLALLRGTAWVSARQRAERAAEWERNGRAERARQEDEAAAAEREAADQARREAQAARERARQEDEVVAEAADRARREAQAARVRNALATVRGSEDPTILCDAALLLGRSGRREAVPDLEVLVRNPGYSSVQGCAASALVRLGEIDTALAFYVESARGADPDLRRSAFKGFGEIGPRAARVALPFLAEALHSPHWDTRYLAVDTLSKLGPTARPLLEEALRDAQKDVREQATRALARDEHR
jgi:tetratricopeptide (TPR) repeat protein